jgi:hypothetical protein
MQLNATVAIAVSRQTSARKRAADGKGLRKIRAVQKPPESTLQLIFGERHVLRNAIALFKMNCVDHAPRFNPRNSMQLLPKVVGTTG